MIWIIGPLATVTACAAIGLLAGKTAGYDIGWHARAGAIVGLVLSALSFGTAGGVVVTETNACERTTAEMGLPGEWAFYTGCLVTLPDGQIVPLTLLRYQDVVGEN